jgi:hypothetical protein
LPCHLEQLLFLFIVSGNFQVLSYIVSSLWREQSSLQRTTTLSY